MRPTVTGEAVFEGYKEALAIMKGLPPVKFPMPDGLHRLHSVIDVALTQSEVIIPSECTPFAVEACRYVVESNGWEGFKHTITRRKKTARKILPILETAQLNLNDEI